jgi:PKD repeat protein
VLPYSFSWDFGDSTSSTAQNPTHTYSNASNYTVTLTVTDSQSSQDNDSLTINASAVIIPLEASFIASPTSGEVPLTLNFTGSATGGVLPYGYSWDFGDSTSSSEQNPSHTYNDAGDYTITLTVTDSQSNQDSDSLIINAYDPDAPLVASCAGSPTLGEVPLTVNFTGNATGGVLPCSYSWDFGDGTSSSEQNPIHIYSGAGDYTATLTVTDSENTQDLDSLIINVFVDEAYISCSPKSLFFGASASGYETTDQNLRIINAGHGQLSWNIEDDADWLSCSPSSGLGRRKIAVSVNASGLPLGLYTATITVSSPEAYNSPQYVSVNLRVYESGQDSSPFGYFDTPVDGSVVSGCIPVTGWALDDIEVIKLEIKRNSDPEDLPEAIGPDGLVYIGDAVFVEGARPDVENSYPDYPLNSRAGWGYTLLTNDLPNRGNGSFTIYGFAYDASGHRVEVGRKTILCDNANSVKPFGTIDTPGQGEIIGGSDYVNFGWALTPLPKTIPKDGSTIWVWVDGVQVGHPVYDQYREDIATSYPEYNNAQGAVGYYYLDTTQYENGVHTISWSVMDDEGEVDGIGSRYFFIDNIETANASQGYIGLKSIYQEDVEGRLGIGIKEVRREYRSQIDNEKEINTKDILDFQIEEMESVRIIFEESSRGNMKYIGWGENEQRSLPIGSTLDRENGIFSWIPTPGFIGRYVLHFAVTDGSHRSKPLQVVVNVIPKRDRNKENW